MFFPVSFFVQVGEFDWFVAVLKAFFLLIIIFLRLLMDNQMRKISKLLLATQLIFVHVDQQHR